MKRLKKEGWGGRTISDNQRLPTAKMVMLFAVVLQTSCSVTANRFAVVLQLLCSAAVTALQ